MNDPGQLSHQLVGWPSEAKRWPVSDIPHILAAGIYAIFIIDGSSLPDIQIPENGLLYIGQTGNLKQRNHFLAKHSGFHSPRRSLGAILKGELNLKAIPRSNGPSVTNVRNFRFTDDGEARLSEWMLQNLEYAACPYDGNICVLEKLLIRQNEPPLNLTLWSNPQRRNIKALRFICATEAKMR